MEKLNELVGQYKIPLAIFLVGVVVIVGNFFFENQPKPKTVYPNASLVDTNISKSVKIDISGAVNVPGVYTFDDNGRMEDAIRTAQGFAADVNKEYVAKDLNLAQKLSDGMKIYIPFSDEKATVITTSLQTPQGTMVNINSGSSGELDSLPGIGTVTAAKIINARPFSTVDDLINRKIVSKSVYEKIKSLITL